MFIKKLTCCFLVVLLFNSCDGPKKQILPSKEDKESSPIVHSYHPTSQTTQNVTESSSSPSSEVQTTQNEVQTTQNVAGSSSSPSSEVQTPEVQTTQNVAESSSSPSSEVQTYSPPSLLINYKNQSLGAIDFSVTKEQADQTLNLLNERNLGNGFLISSYKEGIEIVWNAEGKSVQTNATTGDFSFDDPGKSYPISIGQAIQVSSEEKKAFLINLYNTFENTNINCLKETKCFLMQDPSLPANIYLYIIPKMIILLVNITNNGHTYTQLAKISFEKSNQTYQDVRKQVLNKSLAKSNEAEKQQGVPKEPPTSETPISEPPISEPPTSEPPTSETPISEPPTSEPPTSETPTSETPTESPHPH